MSSISTGKEIMTQMSSAGSHEQLKKRENQGEPMTTIRSPKLSPLHKFDPMLHEGHKKVNSEYPFNKQRKTSKNKAINNGVPETIEEDKKEEDSQPKYVRRSRFPEMRDIFYENVSEKPLLAKFKFSLS